jgi:hypothetical protein
VPISWYSELLSPGAQKEMIKNEEPHGKSMRLFIVIDELFRVVT